MPKLFMVKIGAKPKGRLIEQHDIFFGVAEHIYELVPAINQHWQEVQNDWHLDAYRPVTLVDNYKIEWINQPIQQKEEDCQSSDDNLKLFFINLGGYLPEQFEEYHHKLLIVANNQTSAIKKAKNSDFYKHYTFDNSNPICSAVSHIDDKMMVDIDEIYNVNELLKKGQLKITQLNETELKNCQPDKQMVGYISLKKLLKQKQNI